MKRPWVLVVEDDPDSLDIFVEALSEFGFLAKGAKSVNAALTVARQDQPPCAVISDLMMPTHSGMDLVVAMHADPLLSSIPVILVTGLVPVSPPSGMMVAAVLRKPFAIEELVESLERHCPPGARVIVGGRA